MYIYDRALPGPESRDQEWPITSWPAQGFPGYIGTNDRYIWAHEGLGQLSTEALSKKLMHFSLFPHVVEVGGKDVPLTPSQMDPKFYDGPENYKIAPQLQDCLKAVMTMDGRKFRHVKVALVDLTKDAMRPELAASFDHKAPVFAASVPKIVAMLAAFQLRQDLWFVRQKGAKTLDELFERVRQELADTQHDPGGKATPFTRGVLLRGKLVLVGGRKIPLAGPKAPRLDSVFADAPVGGTVTVKFRSTGEDRAKLRSMVDEFNEAVKKLDQARKRKDVKRIADATRTLRAKQQTLNRLGFWERMGIMVGGDVPASNYATSTVVRDVGFPYIASTLLQSGLYDTNRNGGLWLGADYWGSNWRGPLGGGSAQSATAGSLAAFMTLLVQRRLVSPIASLGMKLFMQKVPNSPFPGTGSWFQIGLMALQNRGSLKTVLAKVGLAAGGADDFAFIEREVAMGGGKKKLLRYVAVGLRAKDGSHLEELIRELDKCILENNGLTHAQGGHV